MVITSAHNDVNHLGYFVRKFAIETLQKYPNLVTLIATEQIYLWNSEYESPLVVFQQLLLKFHDVGG